METNITHYVKIAIHKIYDSAQVLFRLDSFLLMPHLVQSKKNIDIYIFHIFI